MATRKKRRRAKKPFFDDLSPQAKQAIGAVGFVVLAIFFTLSLFDYAGPVGDYTGLTLIKLFGGGAYLFPLVCVFYVYALLNPKEDTAVSVSKIIGIALLFGATLGFFGLYENSLGGFVGMIFAYPLTALVGNIAGFVIFGALFSVGIFLTFNTGISLPRLFSRREIEENGEDKDYKISDIEEDGVDENEDEEDEEEEEEETYGKEEPKKTIGQRLGITNGSGFVVSSFQGPYDPPPLSLLQKDGSKPRGGDIKANSNIIKRTLKNFNIEVEMDEVKIGPSVTQYALKPAEGVRISKIVGLQSNLELALAASPIRIEAPIPGKSLVGVEVPNTQKQKIGLASLLASPEFTDSPKPLLVALGKDITGHVHFADIARMPHALIAGATNSGKSVTIHNLIASLLFRNSPDQLRFIMVDPKRVELTPYNGIPHLLAPVVTDAKKTILSLKWALKEMERRYDILETEKMRDVNSYHESIYLPAKEEWIENGSPEDEKDNLPEPLPYIVIIIDELSDIMQMYPRELESLIVRLAQMSRAIGIHLIIATQRPEVKVITGLIKANIPCRIAMRVNSLIDSRTILDQSGAEKLLGNGDMLFLSPESDKPIRLQSAFVTTDEIKKIVSYLKKQSDAQELDSIDLTDENKDSNPDAFFGAMVDEEDEDELYEDVKQEVIAAGKASTSYLQRKFRIGYSRAARLIDTLEERGVIGEQDGSKPREILSDGNDYEDTEENP